MTINRITGLASGMDIDSMVKDLMKVRRLSLDTMDQKKQKITWQRDAYRDMNKLLRELSDTSFDTVGRQATFLAKNMTSSNENVGKATASGTFSNGTTTLGVTQVAQTAYGISTTNLSTNLGDKVDGSATLQSQASKFQHGSAVALFTGGTFEVKLKAMQQDGTMGSAKSIMVDPTKDSLISVIEKINNANTGVTMLYEKGATGTGDKLSLSMNYTGTTSDGIVALDEGTTNFFAVLGLNKSDLTNVTDGANAQFTVNGLSFQRASNTNVIGGVTYEIKGTGTTTISSQTNVDKIVDNVKSFVTKYNEVITKIYDKIGEEVFREYSPLTNEQKSSLTEKQIEQWEEKAKSGLLRLDSTLSSGLTAIRTGLSDPVTGLTSSFNQLAEIGITTSVNFQEHGKLVIDESKLREAITNDANGVYQLFNGSGSTQSETGLVKRMRGLLNETMKSIEKKAGNGILANSSFEIGRSLIDLEKRMTIMGSRLTEIEDRYYKQFAAMESAINRSNAQSAYIAQQLGG